MQKYIDFIVLLGDYLRVILDNSVRQLRVLQLGSRA